MGRRSLLSALQLDFHHVSSACYPINFSRISSAFIKAIFHATADVHHCTYSTAFDFEGARRLTATVKERVAAKQVGHTVLKYPQRQGRDRTSTPPVNAAPWMVVSIQSQRQKLPMGRAQARLHVFGSLLLLEV